MSYRTFPFKQNRVIQYLCILSIAAITACHQPNSYNNSTSGAEDKFVSKQENGKWTTDFKTAEELKVMRNTIENFTLLNKKKFENLKAYQEFGDLLSMHLTRIKENSRLTDIAQKTLQERLKRFDKEVSVLHGTNMEQSKLAIYRVNEALAAIDSSFTYRN